MVDNSSTSSAGRDNSSYVPEEEPCETPPNQTPPNQTPSNQTPSFPVHTESTTSRDIRINIPNTVINNSSSNSSISGDEEDGGDLSPPPYVVSTETTQMYTTTTTYKSDMPPPSYFSPEVQGSSGFTVTEDISLPQISTTSLQPPQSSGRRREAINVTVNLNQHNTSTTSECTNRLRRFSACSVFLLFFVVVAAYWIIRAID